MLSAEAADVLATVQGLAQDIGCDIVLIGAGANIPSLIALKLISYADREAPRDLEDVDYILRHYAVYAGERPRLRVALL